ncbi:MAG: YciI family protein [Actinomycetota bacterium]
MEYMILLYSDESARPDFAPGTPEFESMMSDWMTFNQELIDSGNFVTGGSLAPSSSATMLHKSFDGSTSTVDGPYAETKEQIGGYYLVRADDLDHALEIAKRIPIPAGSFEVRPIDFRPDA